MKPLINLLGRRFGRLTVVSRSYPNRRGAAVWLCACDCGGQKITTGILLTRGYSQSCGCLQRQRASQSAVTHGQSDRPIYNIWTKMRSRCQNQKNKDFARYGGRGIRVCERWQTFSNFLADMGHPPKGGTIERKDNDGPYSPDNCVWADRKTQGRNTSSNLIVSFGGERVPLAVACERLGLKRNAVYMRMHRGMSFQDAISIAWERIAK